MQKRLLLLIIFVIGTVSAGIISTVIKKASLAVIKGNETPVETAKLYIYKKCAEDPRGYSFQEASKIAKYLDHSKPTVIYVHDYEESLESESVQHILKAYFEKDEHNVILLDWEELAAGSTYEAALNTYRLAPFFARAIIDLFRTKLLHPHSLHLVGHGMGAHLCGSAGYFLKKETDNLYQIRRITGLDPTFSYFYPPLIRHLEKDDAEFVDVIHTDAWQWGAPLSTGTVDFWPNNGKGVQPGCDEGQILQDGNSCNHRRSWRYWAESVAAGFHGSQNIFHAVKCSSWLMFEYDGCFQSTSVTHMGLGVSFGIKGNYYLQTNDNAKFSKDRHGVIFDDIKPLIFKLGKKQ